MNSSKVKLSLLVATHVAGGSLLFLSAQQSPGHFPIAMVTLMALILADAGLIGVWGGLGRTRLRWRAPVLAVVLLYLSTILAAPNSWLCDPVSLGFIAQPSVAIALLLHSLRTSRRGLRLDQLPDTSPPTQRFQFSIRHALLATAAVAIVLGLWRMVGFAIFDDVGMVAEKTTPLCMILVEMATLWAVLGSGRPALRLAVVVPMAFVVPTLFVIGRIPMHYFTPYETSWIDSVWLASVYGIQAVITAASLLVVRSCGWRLRRVSTSNAQEEWVAASV